MTSPENPQKEIQELRERLTRLEAVLGINTAAVSETPEPDSDERFAPPGLRREGTELFEKKPAEEPPPLPVAAETVPPKLPPPLPPTPPAPSRKISPGKSSGLWAAESWLARVGVAVFVVGILLFLKLALDRGWISALVQLGITGLLCLGFLIIGVRLEKQRASLAAMLFGIGVAGLFGTILAGKVFYGLFSPAVASGLTLVVAIAGLIQSLRRSVSSLALIGVLGGYGALVYLGNPALEVILPVFVGSVFFTLAMVLYRWRGWASLYLLGLLLQTVLLSWISANHLDGRWTLLAGLTWFGLLGWWASWRQRGLTFAGQTAEVYNGLAFLGAAFPLGTAVTLAAWVWTGRLSGLGGEVMQHWQSGGFLVAAILLTSVGMLTPAGRPKSWLMAQLVTGQGFLTLALLGWLGGNVLMGALTLQMLALHRLGRSGSEAGLGFAFGLAGHLLAALVFGFLVAMSAQLGAGLRPPGAANLWTLAFVVLSFLVAARWSAKGPGTTATRFLPGSVPSLYELLGYISGVVVLWGWAAAEAWAPAESSFSLAVWSGAFLLVAKRHHPKLEGRTAVYFAGIILALVFAIAAAPREAEGWPILNWRAALVLLALIGSASVVRGLASGAEVVRWSAYGIFLLWLAGQLGAVQGGVWVSPAWALCAIGWMAGGVRRGRSDWRRTAIFTLVLLLARLFLVDLAALDPVWRALIFLGIGGALLLAAFYLPRWTKKPEQPPETPPPLP